MTLHLESHTEYRKRIVTAWLEGNLSNKTMQEALHLSEDQRE